MTFPLVKSAPTRPCLQLVGAFLAALICSAASAQPHKSAPSTGGKPTGQEIYTLTQQYLAAAPKRYVGSTGHAAAEAFIKQHFAPELAHGQFVTEEFHPNTPIGTVTIRDYVVKYPGKKDGVIVLASHYETNYPLKDTAFVGANDGACTTALLIALGQYFRTHPPEGYSVWLLFDDAEEAISDPPYSRSQWSASNSLYGTRSLAAKWSGDGTIGKIRSFLLADMIGDKYLDIDRDGNSSPELLAMEERAARNTGHASALSADRTAIEDDHLPFKMRGVPVLDIIDYNYGPHTDALPDGYHHTAQDTIDKISPRSLQIAADLFLEMVRLINEHPPAR